MTLEQLGPYRIEEELGHGGMATVYRAFHQPLRRYVALKVLEDVLSRDAEFRQRFEHEATIAARLEHPNIVSIYDFGVADGHQYIAMRLIEGATLENLLRDTGPFFVTRALSIAAEMADALACAHEQGVYHRDVKPSNIIMRLDGHPILTDFGIARAIEGLRLTSSQSVVGTPRYMSPEQAQAQPVDHRSDIYSLGVVLYEMLGGQPPFTAASTPSLLYMHVHEAPPPLANLRADLSPGVRDLVERCLAKAPADRLQSAAQVASSCRALLAAPAPDTSGVTTVLPAQAPPAYTPRPVPPAVSQAGRAPAPFPSSGNVTPQPTAVRSATPPYTPRPELAVPPSGWAPTTAVQATTPAPPAARRFSRLMVIAGVFVAVLILIAALFAFAGDRLMGRRSDSSSPAAPTSGPSTTVAGATAAPTAAVSQTAAVVAVASPVANPASSAGSSDSASTHLSDAMSALGRRDYVAALEQANAGLRIDPKDPGLAKAAVQARLGNGEQLWAKGTLDQALVQFLAVREQPLRAAASSTELREADLAAPYLWGQLTWNVDQVVALAEYSKAFRLDPNFRDIRDKVYTSNLALAGQLIAQGNQAGALNYLNAARAADPNRPEAEAMLRQLTPTP